MTKISVYRSYQAACLQDLIVPTKKSAFYEAWQRLQPSIDTMKPATDLCFECQHFITHVMQSAHLTKDQKSYWLREVEDHLEMAETERNHYNGQIA